MRTRTIASVAAVAAALSLSACGGGDPKPPGTSSTSSSSAPAPAPVEYKTADDVRQQILGDDCAKDSGSSPNLRVFSSNPKVQEIVCTDADNKVKATLYGWADDPTFKSDGVQRITTKVEQWHSINSDHACLVQSREHPWAVAFPFYENYGIPATMQELVDNGKAVKSVGDCQAS